MSRTIEADHSKQYLFPASIDDYVGSDHPARFIHEVVSQLDLPSLGYRRDPRAGHPEEGRPHYGARLLLSMWVYAYFFKIESSRKLELASHMDLGLIWLATNEHPDHSTLQRFLSDHPERVERVFAEVVRIASKSGLVGMVLQAVDGTKVKAASSHRTGYFMNRAEETLSKLEASIKARVDTILANDAAEAGLGSLLLPEDLQGDVKLREKVRSAIEAMKAENRSSYHLNEPEAHVMQCGPEKTFGYNAQAVADDKHGIVVAVDVTTEANDLHQLVVMMDAAVAILGARPMQTVADKGYAGSPIFGELQTKGYEAVVAMPKNFLDHPENPFDASHFIYDEGRDVMICPTGPELPFRKAQEQKGTPSRVYQCRVAATCPHRAQCSASTVGRTVNRNLHHAAIEKQRAKYQDPEMKALLKKRSWLIEPVFAKIKQHRGFRRWRLRGLKKVKAQWALVTMAENIRIMYKASKQTLCPG